VHSIKQNKTKQKNNQTHKMAVTDESKGEREKLVYNAKLAEQAERYDEMAEFMKSVVLKSSVQLTVEERNLLSVAYKNAVGARRASWRIITSVEQKEENKNPIKFEIAKEYRQKVEEELVKICNDILQLLDLNLCVAKDLPAESKVFYYKMKGDYHRYISEFKIDKKATADDAQKAYEAATLCSQVDLAPTHPIRLGLALNYSVFHYEILNDREEACRIAQLAFDNAISELDNVNEDGYKDSTLIMQLLRDNLTLWTSTEHTDSTERTGQKDEPEQ